MTKAWDDHKDAIIDQYKDHNKPLHEVQRIMEERYRFKASTRAYRSRLDKWGVYKYSCRKRNGSSSTNEDGLLDEDSAVLSPPPTPGQHPTSPMMDTEDPRTQGHLSPLSPMPCQDHTYFGAGIYGTPPSDLSSPKYGHHQAQYHQQPLIAPPVSRHSIPPPNPGYSMSDSQYRAYYQQPYTSPVDQYRPQSHGYHQYQSQGTIHAVPIPPSPNGTRYTQLHHPHEWANIDMKNPHP